jgi:ankyrin repeat protein
LCNDTDIIIDQEDCIEYCSFDVIQYIKKNTDISWSYFSVFYKLCIKKRTDVIMMLLEDRNFLPNHDSNVFLRMAVIKNYLEGVKLLLNDPRVSPGVGLLNLAIDNRNMEILKLLLKDRRISKYERNEALRIAAISGYTEVVKILLSDPDVDKTVIDKYDLNLIKFYGYTEILNFFN